MSRIATFWGRLLAKVRDHGAPLRLCLRVTVAALASFVLAQFLTVPLAGLWAVLTAVVVTQMSVGGSLQGDDRILRGNARRRGLRRCSRRPRAARQ